MRQTHICPSFVEFIPDHLEEGVLYISERFKTCSHSCCCGCGEEVVTPLSPAEWQLSRDGDAVSLWPSVGNWSYACRSHYVIRWNQVKWAGSMTKKQIARVQQRDIAALNSLMQSNNLARQHAQQAKKDVPPAAPSISTPRRERTSNSVAPAGSRWQRLLARFGLARRN